jgi:hypothetical protein
MLSPYFEAKKPGENFSAADVLSLRRR